MDTCKNKWAFSRIVWNIQYEKFQISLEFNVFISFPTTVRRGLLIAGSGWWQKWNVCQEGLLFLGFSDSYCPPGSWILIPTALLCMAPGVRKDGICHFNAGRLLTHFDMLFVSIFHARRNACILHRCMCLCMCAFLFLTGSYSVVKAGLALSILLS